MNNVPVFLVPYPDGEAIVLATPDEVAEAGGIEAFEDRIRRHSHWYARLGEVPLEAIGVDGSLDGKTISNLVDAWEAKGAVKIIGKAEPIENLIEPPERPQ